MTRRVKGSGLPPGAYVDDCDSFMALAILFGVDDEYEPTPGDYIDLFGTPVVYTGETPMDDIGLLEQRRIGGVPPGGF